MKTSSKTQLSPKNKVATQVNTKPSLWFAVSSLSLGIILSVNLSMSDQNEIDPVLEQEEAFLSGSQANMPISKVDTLNFVRP